MVYKDRSSSPLVLGWHASFGCVAARELPECASAGGPPLLCECCRIPNSFLFASFVSRRWNCSVLAFGRAGGGELVLGVPWFAGSGRWWELAFGGAGAARFAFSALGCHSVACGGSGDVRLLVPHRWSFSTIAG